MAGRPAAFVLAALALAGSSAAAARGDGWVGAWEAAPQPPLPGGLVRYGDQTLRLIVRPSLAGRQLRIRLSNLYGDAPLVVGPVYVAPRRQEDRIDRNRRVTFRGAAAARIPPHGEILSDPVDQPTTAGADLAVSLYLPGASIVATGHILAKTTSYVADGDQASATALTQPRPLRSWPLLTGIEVKPLKPSIAVVAFGDSLVDGDGSTRDANARWTDGLAGRLQAAGVSVSLLNAGIIGNRLLRDSPARTCAVCGAGMGEAGLRRFAHDALDQAGVRTVILRLGTNDLGFPGAFAPAAETVTARDLVGGFRRLVAAAHRRGVRVIGCTIPPFEGATLAPGIFTPEKEAVRQAVNGWIRSGRGFDAIFDFDKVLRDPEHPGRMLPAFDSGDHLHPNDAGYRALAESIPLPELGAPTSAPPARRTKRRAGGPFAS